MPGDAPLPVIGKGEPAGGQHVRFSGLAQAHTPGEAGALAPLATEATGETDSVAEGTGFEPSVPFDTTIFQLEPLFAHTTRSPLGKISAPPIEGVRFATDSPLEGTGFEPLVPPCRVVASNARSALRTADGRCSHEKC
jgi:hypothetical protein